MKKFKKERRQEGLIILPLSSAFLVPSVLISQKMHYLLEQTENAMDKWQKQIRSFNRLLEGIKRLGNITAWNNFYTVVFTDIIVSLILYRTKLKGKLKREICQTYMITDNEGDKKVIFVL